MHLDEILTKFEHPKRVGKGYQVKCPAHQDRVASLSISNGGGKILLHCHAGCEVQSIVEALGLKMADLFSEPKPVVYKLSFKGAPVIDIYNYRDADGNLVYRVLRNAYKNFSQQRLTDSGQWEWGLDGTSRLLYRLPELLADDSDQYVFITEGEKDVNNLVKLGLQATCNSGGAGKFAQDNSALRGRIVVILPDNDEPGRKHAADVSRKLSNVAAKVAILDLPGLPEKGDVSDWIAAGGTKDELLSLAGAALNPAISAPAPQFHPSETLLRPRELTLMGLAARFHERYYRTTRYVEERGVFYNYESGAWRASRSSAEIKTKHIINEVHDEVEAVEKRLKELQARQQAGDQSALKAVGETVQYLENLQKFSRDIKKPATMEHVLTFARSDLRIDADAFDTGEATFNCANGTIDLDAGKFREHRPEDLCSMQSRVEHDPAATCPRWRRFLEEIFLGDQDLISFIQRAIGYSLSGFTHEQVFLILHGDGSNGKSELLFVLDQLFGDYLRSANVDTFMDDRPQGGHNEDIARLRGCRLVTTTETEKTRRLAEGLVKRLTGGDIITASFKHERTFQFVPRFKVWLAANHKPQIGGTDYGIWRRILLIPFAAKFLKAGLPLDGENQFRVDPNLRGDLLKELPGILNWALEGYALWRKQGLDAPQVVRAASEEYRQESDKLGAFLAEEMVAQPYYSTPLNQAYQAFRTWAETGGMKPSSIRGFASDLRARGIKVEKAGIRNDVSIIGYVLLQEG